MFEFCRGNYEQKSRQILEATRGLSSTNTEGTHLIECLRSHLEAVTDEIERLRKERDEARRALAAWQANLEEPQEIDPADLQALIDAAWNGDRLTVRMSARDLWRMATDRRGREEE